jgi:hypothetical protein
MASEAIDLLRNAYYAFGFGLPVAALELFDQLPGRRRARWLAHDVYRRSSDRELPAADGLFANIPPSWEVTRVMPESMKQDGDVVIVTGHVFCRPKGGWTTTTSLPFAHVWTLCRGKAIRVLNCLDGVELRRQEAGDDCARSGVRLWPFRSGR